MMKSYTLQVNGIPLNYAVAGKAGNPTRVFIPGWCGSLSFFEAQAQYFSRSYQVVLIDYPGFGRSRITPESRKDYEPSIDCQARIVEAVLQHEGVESCVVAGHSIGGALALTAAKSTPRRFRAVIGADAFTYEWCPA